MESGVGRPCSHCSFRPSVQGFLISQLALDPMALIARVDTPVLILQGRRGLQEAPMPSG